MILLSTWCYKPYRYFSVFAEYFHLFILDKGVYMLRAYSSHTPYTYTHKYKYFKCNPIHTLASSVYIISAAIFTCVCVCIIYVKNYWYIKIGKTHLTSFVTGFHYVCVCVVSRTVYISQDAITCMFSIKCLYAQKHDCYKNVVPA